MCCTTGSKNKTHSQLQRIGFSIIWNCSECWHKLWPSLRSWKWTRNTISWYEILGSQIQKSEWVITFKSPNRVKVRDEIRVVDPLVLFKRICILKKSDAQLKNYLKYELALYPLALFDDKGMRKSSKSTLHKVFKEDTTIQYNKWVSSCQRWWLFTSLNYVGPSSDIQGHMSAICDNVDRNYGKNCSVVFAGYDADDIKWVQRAQNTSDITDHVPQ